MKPTREQLERLETEAKSWEGTPFREGTALKGVGVSCHNLIAEVYFGARWTPRIFVPQGNRNPGRTKNSLMENTIDGTRLFERVDFFDTQPGDLIGCFIGSSIWHLAIALDRGRIIHAEYLRKVSIPEVIPTAWARRVGAVWRLKEIL